MALVSCPDCGAKVSDLAKACTKCGFPAPFIKKQNCPECGNQVNTGSCAECGFPGPFSSMPECAHIENRSLADSLLEESFHTKCENPQEAFIEAISKNHLNKVKGLFATNQIELNAENKGTKKYTYGLGKSDYHNHFAYETPLHFAVRVAGIDLVNFLIESGANVSAVNEQIGPPLIQAVCSKIDPHEKISSLLRAGANVNQRRTNGPTALHFAALDGDPVSVQMLIDAGAEIDVMADGMGTPLFQAAKGHDGEEVALKKSKPYSKRARM